MADRPRKRAAATAANDRINAMSVPDTAAQTATPSNKGGKGGSGSSSKRTKTSKTPPQQQQQQHKEVSFTSSVFDMQDKDQPLLQHPCDDLPQTDMRMPFFLLRTTAWRVASWLLSAYVRDRSVTASAVQDSEKSFNVDEPAAVGRPPTMKHIALRRTIVDELTQAHNACVSLSGAARDSPELLFRVAEREKKLLTLFLHCGFVESVQHVWSAIAILLMLRQVPDQIAARKSGKDVNSGEPLRVITTCPEVITYTTYMLRIFPGLFELQLWQPDMLTAECAAQVRLKADVVIVPRSEWTGDNDWLPHLVKPAGAVWTVKRQDEGNCPRCPAPAAFVCLDDYSLADRLVHRLSFFCPSSSSPPANLDSGFDVV